jgi:hypothetical protein
VVGGVRTSFLRTASIMQMKPGDAAGTSYTRSLTPLAWTDQQIRTPRTSHYERKYQNRASLSAEGKRAKPRSLAPGSR